MASFSPALVVVDFQEDFCPPNGTLAVTCGRDIAPIINHLMALPFTLRVATQDWHPHDHISFASNHAPPHNTPFTSTLVAKNPLNPLEQETITLWPDHCIQDTPGASLIPEFNVEHIDHVIRKGTDKRVEMYSAFRDTFRTPTVSHSGLADVLKKAEVSHVFVVGLAMDYCVKWTAIHAAGEGYETVIIEEGTKAVDQSEEAKERIVEEMKSHGVKVVRMDGAEVKRVSGRP